MPQTPKILGQNFPDIGIDTTLFTVGLNEQAQFSIFMTNQETEMDRITVALIPNGESETSAKYIAYNTPIIGNAVMAFSGLFLDSGDRVQVLSENGTTSFTATGMLYSL